MQYNERKFSDFRVAEQTSSDAKRAKLMETYTDERILLVGLEEVRFVVHARYLCQSSKYLGVVVGANDSKMIPLPEICSQTFHIYIHWLYSKELVLAREDDMSFLRVNALPLTGEPAYQRCLLELYKTGHFLCDDHFCNTIMTLLSNLEHLQPRMSIVLWLDAGDLPAMLYNWTCDFVAGFSKSQFEFAVGLMLPSMVTDVAVRVHSMLVVGEKPDYWAKQDKCRYHIHGKGIPDCAQ